MSRQVHENKTKTGTQNDRSANIANFMYLELRKETRLHVIVWFHTPLTPGIAQNIAFEEAFFITQLSKSKHCN